MSQPTRAKKSGKNTRSSPSVKQNQTTASRKPVPKPSGPQLFSLSAGFTPDAEPAKPKDIDLFTIRTQGAALDGVHISSAYTAPPPKLDVKPLKATPVPRERKIDRPDLQHTGTIPAYLLDPPARLPDAHRPIPTVAPRDFAQSQPVTPPSGTSRRSDFEEDDVPRDRPARRSSGRRRDDEEDEIPARRKKTRRAAEETADRRQRRRNDFEEDEAPARRKKKHRAAADETPDRRRKRKKPKPAPPPSSREALARQREEAEIRRRQQKRKDRAAMKPVMAYMDGTKQLDLPAAADRPSYANMPKKKAPYVPVREGTGNTLAATIREEREARRKQEERLGYMIVGCVILFLIAAGFLLRIFLNYRRSADEYAGLQGDYVSHMEVAAAQSGDDEETGLQYPPIDINFASLYALNNDLVGWIYVPGCDISYPIVQGEDNDFYLTHTFLGTASSCGAIFMDYADRASFSDFNTFVYGHNMQDGSMFGALHEYWQDETLAEREPYFYVYLRNSTVHKYRICSYYRDAGDSQSYLRVSTPEEKDAYVQMILQKSVLPESTSNEAGAFITGAEDTYVTLSTCQGRIGGGQRFLIHGYLVGVY